MIAIRNHNDTKCELNVAIIRLNQLEEKKQELYCKYFKITGKSYPTMYKIKLDKTTKIRTWDEVLKDENVSISNSNIKTDPMTDYQIALENVDKDTNISLNDELKLQKNEVRKLEYYLKLMENNMTNLKGIEYELYYEIVINPINANKTISKIIEEFSEREDVDRDIQTIWKNYYPSIKKYLKKLEIYSESTVGNVVK